MVNSGIGMVVVVPSDIETGSFGTGRVLEILNGTGMGMVVPEGTGGRSCSTGRETIVPSNTGTNRRSIGKVLEVPSGSVSGSYTTVRTVMSPGALEMVLVVPGRQWYVSSIANSRSGTGGTVIVPDGTVSGK